MFESLWPSHQASSAVDQPAVTDVLQELQEVRDEASATKEQLDSYKESCSRLQEELQVCDFLLVFILPLRVFLMFGEWPTRALLSRKKQLQCRNYRTSFTRWEQKFNPTQFTVFINWVFSCLVYKLCHFRCHLEAVSRPKCLSFKRN